MFVKRWIKITEIIWNKFQENTSHLSECKLYMTYIAEKYLHYGIFTSTFKDCLGFFWLFLEWQHRASRASNVSKMLQKCPEQGKADLMSHSRAGIKCWFHIFKSSEMNLFAAICYTLCRISGARSMCDESNKAHQTPLVGVIAGQLNLKHAIQVTPELEVLTRA